MQGQQNMAIDELFSEETAGFRVFQVRRLSRPYFEGGTLHEGTNDTYRFK